MKLRHAIKLGALPIVLALAISGCSKKEPVVENITLEGGQYPASDNLGMWDSITRNNCTDKAKLKHKDGKKFDLLSFEVKPNPPRKSEDGKYNVYDGVDCSVQVSF